MTFENMIAQILNEAEATRTARMNELKDKIYKKIEETNCIQLCVDELSRGATLFYSDDHSIEFKISFRAQYMNIEKIKIKNGANALLDMILSYLKQYGGTYGDISANIITVQICHRSDVEEWCKRNMFDYVGYGKYELTF